MSSINIFSKLKRILQYLNGSSTEYDLTLYKNILSEIKKLEIEFENRNDSQLQDISRSLEKRAQSEENSDDLLVEAYALVKEAINRILFIDPYDVQIIGGIAMHQGKLAEMQTGEGKTLSAVFPAYLNSLSGKGVNVLTFNDYLARRDALWMGPVYEFLGLNVGFVQEGMSIKDRQKAYQADITYLTAKEAGFDYLRDSLCYNNKDKVQREFNFAIIDEADSILIDEARVPLIIAGASDDYIAETYHMVRVARQLAKNIDFEFDEYARNINLTDHGIKHAEQLLKCNNLFNEENFEILTRLHCAIHAEYLFERDVDYIIRNGKVELVDEFTGRVADKRRWPDGLQAAIEAKENIAIQSKGNILNSITLQHFLQLYPKIAGMTATAQSANDEFKEFYNLNIVVIPPNKPCIREDYADIIFQTREAKLEALVKEIINVHKTKRPILVGTRSVEESLTLAEMLKNQRVQCEVLNAKNDEFEAEIIAQAGKLGAITISTNMAGRGTDIRLGGSDEYEKTQVIKLGGLYVIGTNRHESQRIDNQLRGRAGRQGDPGSSRFFISLDDDLFIKYRLSDLLPAQLIFNDNNAPIENPIVNKEIDRIQRIIDGQNLEIKKTVCKYSSLIENQRKILFQERDDMLNENSLLNLYQENAPEQFQKLSSILNEEKLHDICQQISLNFLDKSWSQYLAEIADIREGIHLMRLGGKVPVLEFHKLAIECFGNIQQQYEVEIIDAFNRIKIKNNEINLKELGLKAPSATWTYLINDNPFENMFGVQLMGNVGLSAISGIYWPLMVLYKIVDKLIKKRRHVK